MKRLLLLSFLQLLILCLYGDAFGQMGRQWMSDDGLAFHKGCLIFSLTEGISEVDYGVKPIYIDVFRRNSVSAHHDPLFIEYGFSREWSAGIELSADLLKIDPSKYYDNTTLSRDVTVIMSDVSLYLSYHYLVTKSFDLSSVFGAGVSAVTINGKDNNAQYQYNTGGYIVRAATRGTYYFYKGLGVTGIVSAFTNYNSASNFKGNTFGKNYLTQIRGFSWELGLCYRVH